VNVMVLGLLLATAAPDLRSVRLLVERGELAAAEGRLRKMAAPGGSPATRALLGVVLSRQARFEEAEKELRGALAASPRLLEGRQELARVCFAQGREAEGLSELRHAARLGPLDRDLLLKLAATELAEGRRAEAERHWRSAAERFASVQAHLHLARLASSGGNAAAALTHLRRALEVAPNSEEVLEAYAQVCLSLRRPTPAIGALEALSRMNPSVAGHRYLLGVGLLQAGDFQRAVEELQEAERLDPQRTLTLIALGLAHNGIKRYTAGREVLERALAREPDNVEALAALAEAEEGSGDLAAAEGHSQRALAQAPRHATANLVRGLVLMKQERYPEAREALVQAVAADPTSAKAHYQLSLAYARLGDEASSLRHRALYQQALKDSEQRIKDLRRSSPPGGGTNP
jgi:tetratricopeptide (TPR) repeat protein